MTQRLAAAAARHPWRAVGAWIAAVVLSFVLIALFLGGALTGEAEQLNNPESERAYELIGQHVPATVGDYTSDVVLIRANSLSPSDPLFQTKVRELVSVLRSTPGVENVVEALKAADDETFDLNVTGEWTVEHDFQHLSEEDLQKGELQFGLPAALIVLLLVFGAVVAGLIPLILALIAIITALGLTSLVGIQFDLSIFTVNMLSGMGLALGIDYSLFVVSRFREERSNGREKLEAITATGSTASRAVLFSGL